MDRRGYLQALSVGLAGLSGCGAIAGSKPPSRASESPTPTETTVPDESASVRIETVTMRLDVPWGAAFHPESGSLYLTEREGRVRRVTPRNGPAELVGGEAELVADFTDDVVDEGEGGLLGLAFHPGNPSVAYTYGTYETDDGRENRLVRHDVEDDFAVAGVAFDGIPAGSERNGGRLGVDSGGGLYATTGDAGQPDRADDRDSLAGKVLRFTRDGDPHPDNPFDSAVFTYGHRDPQGLAFDPGTGAIYATERGPDRDDEINLLTAGREYGWPETMGEGGEATQPVAAYASPIGPAGATFYDGPIEEWQGDLFVGCLSGTHLRRVAVDSGTVTGQYQLLVEEYGRLRTVFTGPDGHLYVTTSNRDGEGHPAPTDDRVLRIMPA